MFLTSLYWESVDILMKNSIFSSTKRPFELKSRCKFQKCSLCMCHYKYENSILSKRRCSPKMAAWSPDVGTEMFQKLIWAFLKFWFFYILGGLKSKLCEFLHFWPFFKFWWVISGKKSKYKESSFQFSNISLATCMPIFSFPSWFLKEKIDFFS